MPKGLSTNIFALICLSTCLVSDIVSLERFVAEFNKNICLYQYGKWYHNYRITKGNYDVREQYKKIIISG